MQVAAAIIVSLALISGCGLIPVRRGQLVTARRRVLSVWRRLCSPPPPLHYPSCSPAPQDKLSFVDFARIGCRSQWHPLLATFFFFIYLLLFFFFTRMTHVAAGQPALNNGPSPLLFSGLTVWFNLELSGDAAGTFGRRGATVAPPGAAQPASFGMSDLSSRALFSRRRRGGGVVLQHWLESGYFVGEVARRPSGHDRIGRPGVASL